MVEGGGFVVTVVIEHDTIVLMTGPILGVIKLILTLRNNLFDLTRRLFLSVFSQSASNSNRRPIPVTSEISGSNLRQCGGAIRIIDAIPVGVTNSRVTTTSTVRSDQFNSHTTSISTVILTTGRHIVVTSQTFVLADFESVLDSWTERLLLS